MASTGRPLGLLPGGGYEERTTQVPPDDLLFFYTDGILDAQNEAGDLLGTERLEAALIASAAPGARVDDVLTAVEAAVRVFRGHAELPDDATIMALRLGN
jgi:sigma-B regulation protein RsbU (phosphoserine phosphatase)